MPAQQQAVDVSGYSMTTTIADIISHIQTNKVQLGITCYDKAAQTEIASFEKQKKFRLPDDFREFYSFSNGLFSDEDMFRLIPLQEILDNGDNPHLVSKNDFHFAEYMTYCDMWTIDTKNGGEPYSIYNIAQDVITLTSSFTEFLQKFLQGGVFGGLYPWRQEMQSQQIKNNR